VKHPEIARPVEIVRIDVEDRDGKFLSHEPRPGIVKAPGFDDRRARDESACDAGNTLAEDAASNDEDPAVTRVRRSV